MRKNISQVNDSCLHLSGEPTDKRCKTGDGRFERTAQEVIKWPQPRQRNIRYANPNKIDFELIRKLLTHAPRIKGIV